MTVKEQILKELEKLSEPDLVKVADYVSYLKRRSRMAMKFHIADNNLAELYGQFADEDRKLAEEGLDDYANQLQQEDEK